MSVKYFQNVICRLAAWQGANRRFQIMFRKFCFRKQLDVYEPFGGGYSRCGGPCGCDMSVSVLAVAYVIIHLPPHPPPLRHTPRNQPTGRPVDPSVRQCQSALTWVQPHVCSRALRSPSACHPTPAATPIPAVTPAYAERRDHQCPPLGGPVSRLLPCQVRSVHRVRNRG